MTASTGRRRCVLLIAYLLLLFVGELSIESSHFPPPSFNGSGQKSCIGRLETAPFVSGSAKLTLCNIGNYAYAAYVKVGTPGYGVWLEVDTGSADTWLMTSDCDSRSCTLRKRFNIHNSSSSLTELRVGFNLTFGRGTRVRGRLITDRMCLAKDTCLRDQTLGAVKQVSQTGMYSDGVLGLGFDSLSRLHGRGGSHSSLLCGLAKLGSSDNSSSKSPRPKAVFGLRLKRHTFLNDDESGGELTIGYANRPETRPAILPLVLDNGGYWMVGLSELEFHYSCTDFVARACKDSWRVPLVTASAAGAKAILDTGSTYILSSSQRLRSELNQWLRRGWVQAAGDHLVTDCDRLIFLPKLRLSFCSNKNCSHFHESILSPDLYAFHFDPSDSCRRRVGVQFVTGLPFTVLGTSFLSNFHTTFDYGAKLVELASLESEPSTKMKAFPASTATREAGEARRAEPFEDFLACLMTIVVAVLLTPFR